MLVTKLNAVEAAERARQALCRVFSTAKGNNISRPLRVYGVPRGGMCALIHTLGFYGSYLQGYGLVEPSSLAGTADVILDDIIDSGSTRQKYLELFPGKPFVALVDKTNGDKDLGWVHFPWEQESGPEDAVVRLLEGIGENPKREGLRDTPKRVVKALREMTEGYHQDPKEILSRVFQEEQSDEIVILRNIPFVSLCEHHVLPYTGSADVGYIPSGGKIVGLSKLARLVHCFAKRLQVQERMTRQIATAIQDNLQTKGVGVIVRASHSCMSCRGVRVSDSEMVTSVMLGVLREDPKARAEFLALCRS